MTDTTTTEPLPRLGWARDPRDGRMYVSADDLATWLQQRSSQWDHPAQTMLPSHLRGRANRREAQGFAKGCSAMAATVAMSLLNDAGELAQRPGLVVPGEDT